MRADNHHCATSYNLEIKVKFAVVFLLATLLAASPSSPVAAGGYEYSSPTFQAGKNACRLALLHDEQETDQRDYLRELDSLQASRLNFCECVGQIYVDQGGALKDDMEGANTAGEFTAARESFLTYGMDICLRTVSENYHEPITTAPNQSVNISDANDFGQRDDYVRSDPRPLPGNTIFKTHDGLTWSVKSHLKTCQNVVAGRTSQDILSDDAIRHWSSFSDAKLASVCHCVAGEVHNDQEAIETVVFSDSPNRAYINVLALKANRCEQALP